MVTQVAMTGRLMTQSAAPKAVDPCNEIHGEWSQPDGMASYLHKKRVDLRLDELISIAYVRRRV